MGVRLGLGSGMQIPGALFYFKLIFLFVVAFVIASATVSEPGRKITGKKNLKKIARGGREGGTINYFTTPHPSSLSFCMEFVQNAKPQTKMQEK